MYTIHISTVYKQVQNRLLENEQKTDFEYDLRPSLDYRLKKHDSLICDLLLISNFHCPPTKYKHVPSKQW